MRQLDSLVDTVRIVCAARSIKRSRVRPSVCPSVSLSHQSNAAAACGRFAAERRTRKRCRSTARGARQQQRRSPGPQHGAQPNFSSVHCLCGICVRMATCTELYIDTLGGLDLDGSTDKNDKNLPYFVVENLANLPTSAPSFMISPQSEIFCHSFRLSCCTITQ